MIHRDEFLATDDNTAALSDLPGIRIDRVHDRRPPKMVVLDMDSSVSPTYGDQEGTAYYGHFGCACYHPLFLFNHMGDLERCRLRPGNVHSADGWRDVAHGRYVTFQMAEVAVLRELLRRIVERIEELRPPTRPAA